MTSRHMLRLLPLALVACSDHPLCPEGWGDVETADAVCAPPAEVTAAVEQRIETGIYGYVVRCFDSDGCVCGEVGLFDTENPNAWFFSLDYHDEANGTVGVIDIPIERDGTFAIPLEPSVSYSATVSRALSSRGEPVETFTLAAGEVRFLRVTTPTC